MERLRPVWERGIRWLVLGWGVLAGAAVVGMIAVTVVDVVMRSLFRHPLTGAYDLVKVQGLLAIACGLPYTTAVKGHIAVEFVFQKLSRRSRVVVDTLCRLAGIALWLVMAWQMVVYAESARRSGEVTLTLQLPVYPIIYAMAVSCVLVVPVKLYHLFHPGKAMIKP
ncbi:MAG: Tripartite ATP-independent periplasmic transporter [Lentisphaerae bacterium ADurb.BinA184]|nr:MAG: Tripartite ATP-independent periplasmic transporter [Lentisphaerae bacterium ADurb.BinA184]